MAFLKKALCVGAAIVLASSCYNTKMMEFTYQELDSVKTVQAELLQKLNAIERQMAADRQQNVRTRADFTAMMQELRDLVETLGYQITDFRPTSPPSRQTETSRPTPPPVETSPDTATGFTPADEGPDTQPVAGDSDANKMFKGSYMDLTLGNYDLAVQGFKNYLVRYPSGTNEASAHYYLAESYYALDRYLEAVAEYQTVIHNFGQSRFAPAAFLKSGLCYQRLEEKQLAQRAFRELISKYPRSEEAEQARVALQETEG